MFRIKLANLLSPINDTFTTFYVGEKISSFNFWSSFEVFAWEIECIQYKLLSKIIISKYIGHSRNKLHDSLRKFYVR